MVGIRRIAPALLEALRQCFEYDGDRATGYLYVEGEQDWPAPLAELGPQIMSRVGTHEIVAFQAYRNGHGVGWHVDSPFGDQVILSLGARCVFGVRELSEDEPIWRTLVDGDIVVVPEGWEHCVEFREGHIGERCSLVFRNRRKP